MSPPSSYRRQLVEAARESLLQQEPTVGLSELAEVRGVPVHGRPARPHRAVGQLPGATPAKPRNLTPYTFTPADAALNDSAIKELLATVAHEAAST